MRLQRHHLIAIALALSLLFVVFAAAPAEGQVNLPGSGMCAEEWVCAEWSDCIQSFMIRECIDTNQCGTFMNKSEQAMPCESKPEDNKSWENCTEEWVCSPWDDCDNGIQKRQCEDIHHCGTGLELFIERQCKEQCMESWECDPWSDCDGGLQHRRCHDIHQCGIHEPVSEAMECEPPEDPEPGTGPPVNGTPGGGNVTLPSNATVNESEFNRIYDEIIPDAPASIIIDNPELGISKIRIETKNRVTDVRFIMREIVTGAPHDIAPEPNIVVYKYLEIFKENMTDDDMEKAIIDFNVDKEWLREQLINVSTLRLRRYEGDAWADLPTKMLYDDNEKFYFQAEAPGFSIFTIAGEYMLEKSGGGLMCLPLDVRCYGNEIQECDIYGLSWTIIEECEHGCRGQGVCIPEYSDQSPAQAEDYVIILMLALLVIIALLGFAVMFFKLKRKRISQDLNGPMSPPGIRKQ